MPTQMNPEKGKKDLGKKIPGKEMQHPGKEMPAKKSTFGKRDEPPRKM